MKFYNFISLEIKFHIYNKVFDKYVDILFFFLIWKICGTKIETKVGSFHWRENSNFNLS